MAALYLRISTLDEHAEAQAVEVLVELGGAVDWARMSEEPENWRRRVYKPGFEMSDELAAMLEERWAENNAPSECLFPDDPKVQTPQRNGYTRDENILREWHREVFGESLWIDSKLHEEIRKRTIEFRRNPDVDTVPWEQVKTRLQRRASALRGRTVVDS